MIVKICVPTCCFRISFHVRDNLRAAQIWIDSHRGSCTEGYNTYSVYFWSVFQNVTGFEESRLNNLCKDSLFRHYASANLIEYRTSATMTFFPDLCNHQIYILVAQSVTWTCVIQF